MVKTLCVAYLCCFVIEILIISQEAFDVMGFEDSETHDLYASTAGIMHMGEMKFKQRPREEQAEPDGDEGL